MRSAPKEVSALAHVVGTGARPILVRPRRDGGGALPIHALPHHAEEDGVPVIPARPPPQERPGAQPTLARLPVEEREVLRSPCPLLLFDDATMMMTATVAEDLRRLLLAEFLLVTMAIVAGKISPQKGTTSHPVLLCIFNHQLSSAIIPTLGP